MKRFFIIVLLVTLVVLGYARFKEGKWTIRKPEQFSPAQSAPVEAAAVRSLAASDEEFTRLVEAVVPSVVSLTTSRRVQVPQVVDPFEFFFGGRGRAMPRERVQNSLGSGVIVSKEGHIITNHHVVAQMDEVKVQLSDGRSFDAKVIGAEPQADIAILKIDAPNLTPLPLGDSDKVKVGQLVFAIGNPFGLEESVSMGIISAKGRRAMEDSSNEFFQTDTAINPGNSGGPLINVRGEIIAINSAIYSGSGTGAWQGIGFAIPANTVKRILDSVIKNGRVIRGYLGVAIQPVTRELASQFNLPDQNGALVTEVTPGSPAEKAGIQPGDVIRSLNGNNIKDGQQLRSRIADIPVGADVQVQVLREGKELKLGAQIAEHPGQLQAGSSLPAPAPRKGLVQQSVLAGVEVSAIPDEYRDELPPNAQGVLVTGVNPRSAAARILQPGDLIEEINRQPVASPEEYQQALQKFADADKLMLFIARGKARSFVVIARE